jgi:hypothetical protein
VLSTTANKVGLLDILRSAAVIVFASDGWHGPQPRAKNVLKVSAVGGGRVHRVRCEQGTDWRVSIGTT